MAEYRTTDNEHVARMLDGADELPCAFCETLAPVPDYVLAVGQFRGRQKAIVVCAECSETLAVVLPMFYEGLTGAIARAARDEGE